MIEKQHKNVLDWIESQSAHMTFLTDDWAKVNSGSYNHDGIVAIRTKMADNFHWLGGNEELLEVAKILSINAEGQEVSYQPPQAFSMMKRPNAPLQVLLVGHMDTVYASNHRFQSTEYLSEKVLRGPGVADMKGGIVVMLKALEAFEKYPGASRVGWQVLLTPDEEIGSIGSDPLLKKAAAGKTIGMIYEPALVDGTLAGARKGSGNFSLVVRGRAAHAGRNPEEGRNAIVAAARLTQDLFALNGERPGVTINPGRVEGGGPLNMVPDLAILHYNVRTQTIEDEGWVTEAVARIAQAVAAAHEVSVTPHGHFTRPPKPMSPENKRLFDLVVATGQELGLTLAVKPSGGCCDGNNLWRYGLPNVDTLGVRGANIHSDQEIVYLDSLVERAQLSALLLMKLADGVLG